LTSPGQGSVPWSVLGGDSPRPPLYRLALRALAMLSVVPHQFSKSSAKQRWWSVTMEWRIHQNSLGLRLIIHYMSSQPGTLSN